jgi:hypothetical protein
MAVDAGGGCVLQARARRARTQAEGFFTVLAIHAPVGTAKDVRGPPSKSLLRRRPRL